MIPLDATHPVAFASPWSPAFLKRDISLLRNYPRIGLLREVFLKTSAPSTLSLNISVLSGIVC